MELEKLKLEMMPRLNYSLKPAVPRGVAWVVWMLVNLLCYIFYTEPLGRSSLEQ